MVTHTKARVAHRAQPRDGRVYRRGVTDEIYKAVPAGTAGMPEEVPY